MAFGFLTNLFNRILGRSTPTSGRIEYQQPVQNRPESTEVIQGKFMFLTQEDDRVDPEICAPLNRTEYDMSDPDIPTPPLHRHCRCILVPIVE